MGFTFGTTIRKKDLSLVSLRNECLSLVICLVVGLFWGVIAGVSDAPYNRDWPSAEMLSRGDPYGLTSGILIAIPSGVATALRFVPCCFPFAYPFSACSASFDPRHIIFHHNEVPLVATAVE